MTKPLIIIGGGGHGAVLADIARLMGYSLTGFLDDGFSPGERVMDAPVLGPVADWEKYPDHVFTLGVGDNTIRRTLAERLPVSFATLIHPSVVIASGVKIGEGTVIMAGVVVNPRTEICRHVILNTRASIDHDCKLADYVHVSPGAALGGGVTVGEGTHIGIGASVKHCISIGGSVVIGAGAAVVKDITEPGVYVGVPAKRHNTSGR